jgi:hypothetical protein
MAVVVAVRVMIPSAIVAVPLAVVTSVVVIPPACERNARTKKNDDCRYPHDFDPPGFHVASLAVFGYRV